MNINAFFFKILMEENGKVWIGLIWLRKRSGGLLRTR